MTRDEVELSGYGAEKFNGFAFTICGLVRRNTVGSVRRQFDNDDAARRIAENELIVDTDGRGFCRKSSECTTNCIPQAQLSCRAKCIKLLPSRQRTLALVFLQRPPEFNPRQSSMRQLERFNLKAPCLMVEDVHEQVQWVYESGEIIESLEGRFVVG